MALENILIGPGFLPEIYDLTGISFDDLSQGLSMLCWSVCLVKSVLDNGHMQGPTLKEKNKKTCRLEFKGKILF